MAFTKFMGGNRKFRSKILEPIAKFLLKLKITANRMTLISFLLGIITVYFLFQNHLFFIIFAVLHLLADGFDGVLARLSEPTLKGKYLDCLSDRSISLFILIKMYFYLQDYYILIILFLFILSQSIHLLSKCQYPVFFMRTSLLVYLTLNPLFALNFFLTIAYLGVGIFSLYALILQLRFKISSS